MRLPRTILGWPMPESWRSAAKASLLMKRTRIGSSLSLALSLPTARLDSAKSTLTTCRAPALAAATPTPQV
jgi:hypothetical protein